MSAGPMRGEVCGAAQREGQRSEIVGLREACLDRRRGQLLALTSLLAEAPNPATLDRAVQAAAGLCPVAYCADDQALTAPVRPPEDPAVRARVAELLPRVDRLEALYRVGRYKEGLVLGDPLLAEAATIPYGPLRGQAQYWMGMLHASNGDYDVAEALLREAAISAAEGRDDVLAVSAWSRLLTVVASDRKHFEEAVVIRKLGPTVLVRVKDDRALATRLTAEGSALNAMSGVGAAASLERALVLWEKVVGHDDPEVAAVLNNLGNCFLGDGDFPAALERYSSALSIHEKIRHASCARASQAPRWPRRRRGGSGRPRTWAWAIASPRSRSAGTGPSTRRSAPPCTPRAPLKRAGGYFHSQRKGSSHRRRVRSSSRRAMALPVGKTEVKQGRDRA